MTGRFFPPPHGEARKLDENVQASARERSIRQWATPDRAASIATRAGILEATRPGDGAAVVGSELANINPADDASMSVIREGMWAAAEGDPNYDDDPLRNDVFNFSINPNDLLGETMGWWNRSPGHWLGTDAPVVSSAPVKGIARWFTMAFDAGVDAASDRIIRAGYDAVRETGSISFSDPGSFVTWGKEFVEEYAHGEDIGNKPLWGALGELTSGNRVNLGTGYMANSELTPEIQADMDNRAQAQEMSTQESQHLYDTDRQAWLDKYNTYQNPSQQSAAIAPQAMQNQLRASMGPEDMNAEAWRAGTLGVQGIQQMEQFGRPLTQQSIYKQEAYGGFFKRAVFADPNGRQTYSQVSVGQALAMVVSEPGTGAHHWISGGIDFAKQIFADPANYIGVGAVGKVAKARRGINATTDAAARVNQTRKITEDLTVLYKGKKTDELAPAFRRTEDIVRETDLNLDELLEMRPKEASILLDSRARKTIEAGDANRWLTGEQAQPMVTALTEAKSMDEVAALMSNVKGKQPAKLHAQLYDAVTEGEVIDALLPVMGEMQFAGSLRRSAGISSYKAADYIPFVGNERYTDLLWDGIDMMTEAAFDRAYQVQQRGLARGLTPGGHIAMPTPGLSSRAQARNMGGQTWIGRAFNNTSNTGIRTDDIDVGYAQLRRLARNYGIDGDSVLSRTSDGRIIKANDTDGLLAQLVEGEKLTGKTRRANEGFYRFAQTNHGNHSRAFDGVIEVMEVAALQMEMDGINPAFIKQVTSAVVDQGEFSKFATNAIGETAQYPGSGFMALAGDKVTMQPGMQLISEMYSGNINVPDASVLRKTLAEKPNQFLRNITDEKVNIGLRRALNNFTTQKVSFDLAIRGDGPIFSWKPKGNLQERVIATYARRGIANVWKPMKLLRFGYIPKIILGDEQGRMTAAGLSSMWAPGRMSQGDSPLAYISYLIGRKGNLDLTDNPIKAAREFQDTVSLRGNVYGEVGAMRSEHWGSAKWGTPQYEDGLATELVQLAEDPISRNMLNPDWEGDVIGNTRTWLIDGEGEQYLNIITDKIAQDNPFLAERLRGGGQELTNYLEAVQGRAHLKTGGDYVYIDPDTGTIMNSFDKPYNGPDLGLDAGASGTIIIRRGDEELLNGIRNGYIGEDAASSGVRMSGLKPEDYQTLRNYVGRRIKQIDEDQAAGLSDIRLPDGVKHEQVGYAYHNKQMATRIVDTLMDFTVAKPAEALNRSVAYKQFYWRNVGTMLPAMTDEAVEATLILARKAKVEGLVLEQASRARKAADGPIGQTIDDIEEASKFSHAFASEAVKDLLFDFSERKNFFDAISLISPFADAWLEAFTSWGKLFAQDPTKLRRPLKALDELRDDNPLEWGAEAEQDVNNGFFHMNDYGNEVFTIPAPIANFIGKTGEIMSNVVDVIPGVDTDFETSSLPELDWEVSTESLNMIAAQFYPAVGPVVSIPAAGVIPTDTIGGQKLRDALFPFGLGENLKEELFNQTFGASPSLKRFLNAITEGKFVGGAEERMFNQTKGWLLRDMIVSGEVTAEDLADPNKNTRIQAELSDRAQNIYLFRSVMQFLSPAAPFAPGMIADPDVDEDAKITAIALQDGARAYYDLVEEFDGDHEKASLMFDTQYGFDPLPLLISMSKKEYDRATTEGSYQAQLDHPEFFEQFPATAYFLHPDDPSDPFYYRAWSGQLGSDARDPKSVTEQMDEYVYRTAAARYDAFDTQITEALNGYNLDEKSYREIREMTLNAYQNELIDEFSEYAAQVKTYSSRKQQTTISELRTWSSFDPFKDNPTVLAVDEFFEAWDELEKVLKGMRDTTVVTILPFKKTGAQYSEKSGKGQSWRDRHFVNSILLGIGDDIARQEGNGEFATVWEQLIKPTIYDYEQDRPEAEEEEGSVEELVDQLIGEFG